MISCQLAQQEIALELFGHISQIVKCPTVEAFVTSFLTCLRVSSSFSFSKIGQAFRRISRSSMRQDPGIHSGRRFPIWMGEIHPWFFPFLKVVLPKLEIPRLQNTPKATSQWWLADDLLKQMAPRYAH